MQNWRTQVDEQLSGLRSGFSDGIEHLRAAGERRDASLETHRLATSKQHTCLQASS